MRRDRVGPLLLGKSCLRVPRRPLDPRKGRWGKVYEGEGWKGSPGLDTVGSVTVVGAPGSFLGVDTVVVSPVPLLRPTVEVLTRNEGGRVSTSIPRPTHPTGGSPTGTPTRTCVEWKRTVVSVPTPSLDSPY